MDLEQNIMEILSGFSAAIASDPQRGNSTLLQETVKSILIACAIDTMDYCDFAAVMEPREMPQAAP